MTAGTTLDRNGLAALARAGLRSVQLSIQDAEAAASDAIAGVECFETKLAFAAAVRELGLPLTLNVVLHRHNLARVAEITALAQRLGAARLELANAQYQGWALRNRAALLPTRAQLDAAAQEVARLRRETPGSRSCSCCPTITVTARSRAWAGGDDRVSWSRRMGACCRATARPSCPDSSSGAFRSARSPSAGRTRRA